MVLAPSFLDSWSPNKKFHGHDDDDGDDDDDDDDDGGGGEAYPVVSTQLIVIVCLSRQKTRPGRKHTLPYDDDDINDEVDDSRYDRDKTGEC